MCVFHLNCPYSRFHQPRYDLDLWRWPSISGEWWSWPIHMQKVEVKGQSVKNNRVEAVEQTDIRTEQIPLPLEQMQSVTAKQHSSHSTCFFSFIKLSASGSKHLISVCLSVPPLRGLAEYRECSQPHTQSDTSDAAPMWPTYIGRSVSRANMLVS